MKTRRVLAAAAVAGWSKGILGAAVMEQPAGAMVSTAAPTVAAPTPQCTPTPTLSGPSLLTSFGEPARVSVYVKGPSSCPGTLDILVTSEQGNWGKAPVIASQHVAPYQPANVQCLPGTFWYKGRFVSDDGSVSINTDSAGTKFTCF
jgi:hypothetical protein